MTADDPEDILNSSYRPTSWRQDAISVFVAIVIGLLAYYVLVSIPAVTGIVEGLPLSPSLISIGIALFAYLLLDAGMMRR